MAIKSPIIIIGTGPAALMAGSTLLERGEKVIFYEQKKAAGRKFLVAGHGGFNLSNSIDKTAFLTMYDKLEIVQMVDAFDADDLVVFLRKIGIATYIGSSGKIFPEKHIKPIDVLQQWLDYLENKGAVFHYGMTMRDFDNEFVYLEKDNKILPVAYGKLILALGGGSWSKTGSTGSWLSLFKSKGIETLPFQASNAGFNIEWTESMIAMQGMPIKHVLCKLGSEDKFGEIVLTTYGLEGAPIFYLNRAFRNGADPLYLDAKPYFSLEKIIQVLSKAKHHSEGLKILKISKVLILYIKEHISKEDFMDSSRLAYYVKNIPFRVESLQPIDDAISTVGGVPFTALNNDLSLKCFPDIYCCGEMLDWDAPTGGYLLQACFAGGVWIGNQIK